MFEPEPDVPETQRWVVVVDRAVPVVLATGVVVALVGALATPTLGARRSTRLRWETRALEVDAVVGARADDLPR